MAEAVTPQPKALELAERLECCAEDPMWANHCEVSKDTCGESAAELRRQHAEIEALRKGLALVQQHHATAWNRGHAAGLRAARDNIKQVNEAVQRDAWGNSQLTEALLAAESERDSLRAEVERLECDVQGLKQDQAGAMGLVADIRQALGDNGRRMQDELIEWCAGLRADAERLDFITEHRVLVSPEFEGCWDATRYDDEPEPVASFSGSTPRAAIDAAREAKG